MAGPTFNFDPYLNTCFREESPDQPLTTAEGDQEAN